jgi:aryl-alcohol dehydrogenase-like predicted oxidoreductase
MKYRNFGRGTGLRVSELALGCGLFGTRWGYGTEPEDAEKIFRGYREAGGNFIDTSNSYQSGQSEEILGALIGNHRDDLLLASKYTLGGTDRTLLGTGNSRRAMVSSIEGSLRRLRTDRIDLYWVHRPDDITSTDEFLRGLDDLVSAGKILYIGLSDFPAWRVAHAATLAELRGWASVSAIQIEYSLIERTSERELLPMAEAFGLGVTAWSPLGGGVLTGKYRSGEEGRATTFGKLIHSEGQDARNTAVIDALLEMAGKRRVSGTQIALAWIRSKGIVPIIGPRTPAQLSENLAAANLDLSDEEVAVLDASSHVALGFPHDFLADQGQRELLAAGVPGHLIADPGPGRVR